jgi:hypothetical protein
MRIFARGPGRITVSQAHRVIRDGTAYCSTSVRRTSSWPDTMSAAVGTSLLVIVVNALVALAARAHSAVHLDWALIAPFLATAVLGAWDGRRLAAKISAGTLQRVFGAVLLGVAVAMAVTAVL